MIPPHYEIQARAWECAYVLRDCALPLADRVCVEEVYRVGPEALGWHDAAAMFRLANLVMPVRV